MPGWYRRYQDRDDLRIVGLIQEQHPERCRLFMAWKDMDFPVLVDALNRIDVHAVPLLWAIDEHGVVRKTRPDEEWITGEFLATDYAGPTQEPRREAGDAAVSAYLAGEWDAAVAAFRSRVAGQPDDAEAWFGLGCAYRARHDRGDRQPGDFQEAVEAWTEAVGLAPRNYIFRRRLQQYGPRLDKPYPFYDWVHRARAELAERGAEIPPLAVPLEGAETAEPRRGEAVEAADPGGREPDPEGVIPRDEQGLVRFEGVVAPQPVEAGGAARVYLRFLPDEEQRTTWDNEAGRLQVWLEPGEGLTAGQRLHLGGIPREPSTAEDRTIEVELAVTGEGPERRTLRGHAVYFVCSGESGECVFRRQDFTVPVAVRQ